MPHVHQRADRPHATRERWCFWPARGSCAGCRDGIASLRRPARFLERARDSVSMTKPFPTRVLMGGLIALALILRLPAFFWGLLSRARTPASYQPAEPI